MVTDTLPVGMRGNTPVVTSVTRGGVTLTENVNYTVSWNSGTGVLIVDLTAGSAGPTNIPAGAASLVVRYTASASNDAGAGATLTNSAVVAYNSWSGSGGRSSTTTPATSSITVSSATAVKIENAAGNAAAIGQPFYYTVGAERARAVPPSTTPTRAISSPTAWK